MGNNWSNYSSYLSNMPHSQILSFYKFRGKLLKTDHPKKQGKLVKQIKYQMYIIIYRSFNKTLKDK